MIALWLCIDEVQAFLLEIIGLKTLGLLRCILA